jgi:hypothetical protein
MNSRNARIGHDKNSKVDTKERDWLEVTRVEAADNQWLVGLRERYQIHGAGKISWQAPKVHQESTPSICLTNGTDNLLQAFSYQD